MSSIFEAIDAQLIEPQRLAQCVLDHVKSEAKKKPADRVRLTYREALIALLVESQIVTVTALNVANDVELSEADKERLIVAHRTIERVVSEVLR